MIHRVLMCETPPVFIPTHSACLLAGHKVESLACLVYLQHFNRCDNSKRCDADDELAGASTPHLQTCSVFNAPRRDSWEERLFLVFC